MIGVTITFEVARMDGMLHPEMFFIFFQRSPLGVQTTASRRRAAGGQKGGEVGGGTKVDAKPRRGRNLGEVRGSLSRGGRGRAQRWKARSIPMGCTPPRLLPMDLVFEIFFSDNEDFIDLMK